MPRKVRIDAPIALHHLSSGASTVARYFVMNTTVINISSDSNLSYRN